MKMGVKHITLHFVGMKHTGPFEEYPNIIPKAIEEFNLHKTEVENGTGPRGIVYEPIKCSDHLVGYFYTGIFVETTPSDLPEGMEYINIQGDYAVLKDNFDINRMGEFYSSLDNWIVNNGYKKDYPNGEMIEIYTTNDVEEKEELQVLIPLINGR